MNPARFIRFFTPGRRIAAIIAAVVTLMPVVVRSADYEIAMIDEYRYMNGMARAGHDGCVIRLDGRFDFAQFAERNPMTWEMEEYAESVGYSGIMRYGGYVEWLKHNTSIFHGSGREEGYVSEFSCMVAQGLEPNVEFYSGGWKLPQPLPLERSLQFELLSGEWAFWDLYEWNFRGRWTERSLIGRKIARAERLAAAAAAGIDEATLQARGRKATEQWQIRQALTASLHQPSGMNVLFSNEDAARLDALKKGFAGAASEDFVESSSFYPSPPVYYRGLRREQAGGGYVVFTEAVYDFMGREYVFSPNTKP